MLFILYVISSAFLVWNIDAQKEFGFGQYSNYDFNSLIFGNYNGYSQDGGGNDYTEPSNGFSGATSSNTQRLGTNNGFGVNNGASNNKLNARAAQQPAYQDNSVPQSQILSQKSKSQQQNFQTSSQTSYQQSQQQSFQQNVQTQQQSFTQTGQQQQPYYQQNTQPQQQHSQNVQAQQQLHQQNSKAQQQYQQNSQTQQQLYQQSGQPQQELFQQNGQPQQQTYQQSGQPQQQTYQQNGQPQQQTYQQSGQAQQQSYQPNQNFAGSNGGYQNSQNPTVNVLSTTYGEDGTRTGKPKQNANYNNATFAITRFGLKMFKAMNRDYQNIVASPYSVAALLSLVQQGAHGETQQEITQLLQLTPESSANLFKSLTNFMKKRKSQNVFKVGSNVCLAKGFNIVPEFKAAALNNFGSDVRTMDFKNPYNAAQQINQWVAGQTNQKIQNLLVPEAIQQDTLAMLVNAVYFKGVWDKKFDPKMTTSKEFTLSDGSKKPVLFMETRRSFQVDMDPVTKSYVLLMPFEGTQYTMMFILPFKGVYASDVLSSLTEPQLYAYQRITPKEVKVEIPKFNIKKDSDIAFILNLLGLWQIFSPEVDLTGMGRHNGQSPRITSGQHTAVLSIDEQGSTAAAATVFSVVALSYDDPITSFTANRPFLAILWDKELSMPLFMAKIEDPEP